MVQAGDRRLHLLCVGAPKTGTHSVAGLFARSFRSEHEPHVERLIDIATGYLQGDDEDRVIELLSARDAALDLEVESSNPLGILTPLLVRAFPAARFVITVREPVAWLGSEVNSHLLTGPESAYRVDGDWGGSEPWPGPARAERWRQLRFGQEGPSPIDISRRLVAMGLFPVEGYLTYWTRHYRACLAAIAVGRALVVLTHRLTTDVPALARFAGVDPRSLDRAASHRFAAPARSPLVSELDCGDVVQAVERICGPMWRAYQELAHVPDGELPRRGPGIR